MAIALESSEIRARCPHCADVIELVARPISQCRCGREVAVDENVHCFVDSSGGGEEKEYYDDVYRRLLGDASQLALSDAQKMWDRPEAPELRVVMDRLGDLAGKKILLLGNGLSMQEIAFLAQKPFKLVYTDLSPNASIAIKDAFDFGEYESCVRFAAVDAAMLPFVDESFDVVYAFAMVHHLEFVEDFLAGVYRVLKPGGRAIFMDDGYAPVWHYAKQTVLRPLMSYSHRRTGISPADYRFSMSGGFREEDLEEAIRSIGGTPFMQRTNLLPYLITRAATKLAPRRFRKRINGSAVVRGLVRLDFALSRFGPYRRNQIRLVWGFEKNGSS